VKQPGISASPLGTLMTQLRPILSETAVTEPDLAQEQAIEPDEALEKLWKIIAHDDPITTMDFVVRIMVQIFKKPLILAEAIMWQVHNEGLSVVDTLPRPEAEYRVRKATAAARLEGFPFRFTLEPEE
jgi:ATP-dependent Clp protease adaptor protein ClpS